MKYYKYEVAAVSLLVEGKKVEFETLPLGGGMRIGVIALDPEDTENSKVLEFLDENNGKRGIAEITEEAYLDLKKKVIPSNSSRRVSQPPISPHAQNLAANGKVEVTNENGPGADSQPQANEPTIGDLMRGEGKPGTAATDSEDTEETQEPATPPEGEDSEATGLEDLGLETEGEDSENDKQDG